MKRMKRKADGSNKSSKRLKKIKGPSLEMRESSKGTKISENVETVELSPCVNDSDVHEESFENENASDVGSVSCESEENHESCDELEQEDEELDSTDCFTKHFRDSLHPKLLESLESSPPCLTHKDDTWPILRNVVISMPSNPEAEAEKVSKKLLEDEITYTTGGNLPKIRNLKDITPKDIHIKAQIAKHLVSANCALNDSTDETRFLTEFQNELFCVMNNYQDLYYSKQTLNNAESVRFVYCLHVANHILKRRTEVLRHNERLKKTGSDDVPDEFRDQGFVRPKVLVVLPFKSSAFKVISLLIKLLFGEGKKGSVMNKKRFLEEYQGESQKIPVRKPEEYKMIFSGNTEDDFTMGISVTRKAIKLYSEFYSSDIIVAAPLSLRRIIGAKGEKERDYDFLSSIELMIFDQTEIFMMQSWHHILHLSDHLHLKLKEYRRTDFSRVRLWSLDGHARFYRQTIILSSVNVPLIESFFINRCRNYAGRVAINKYFAKGAIANVLGERNHTFFKFSVGIGVDIPEKRFECFMNNVFPLFYNSEPLRQVLIYIPVYYDFVRLRNHFMKESINFNQICEYSPQKKVAEARDLFCNKDVHFLLYTERYHFYNRITLKGIRHIIFYDLPTYPHYYTEICNMMNNENLLKPKRCLSNFTVSALYTDFCDYTKLAAIVGTKKARNMIKSNKTSHLLFAND